MRNGLEMDNQQSQINCDCLNFPEVQDAILKKQITERHARSLIPLKDPEKQVKLIRRNH